MRHHGVYMTPFNADQTHSINWKMSRWLVSSRHIIVQKVLDLVYTIKKDYCAHLFSQITPGWPLLHLRFCFRRSTCIEMIVTFWEKFIIHCHVLKTHVKLEFKIDGVLILQRQETIQEVENYYVCCSAGDGNTPGIGQPVTENSSRCSQHCEKYQSSQLAPWKQQRSLWATERTCWISRTS